MIIILDNYDSFTYNLYQYVGCINPNTKVYRNDKIKTEEILAKNPSHIILSSGCGLPNDKGIMMDLIRKASSCKIPILGISLGHLAIGKAFKGKIQKTLYLIHGKSEIINIDPSCPIFHNLPDQIEAGRYHSYILDEKSLDDFNIVAKSKDNEVFAIAHKKHFVYGVQFNPESVLTPYGMDIIRNFLSIKGSEL